MKKIKGIKNEWHQYAVIHCPDPNCDGLLLANPYYHPMKCSKCNKLWMEITTWKEVKELS